MHTARWPSLLLTCLVGLSAGGLAAGATVPVTSFGSVGHGGDDSAVFRTALTTTAAHGDTLEVPAGAYRTGTLAIPSDTHLQLDAGATITAVGGFSSGQHLIDIANVHDVAIAGAGATSVFRMPRADYTDGSEYRHCISIVGSTRVALTAIAANEAGGDGLYIAGASADITVSDCVFDHDARNGLSLISVAGLVVERCTFSNTAGNSGLAPDGPWDGIDIEPNVPSDRLVNVAIRDTRCIGNAGQGMTVTIGNLDATSQPLDITIDRSATSGNAGSGYYLTNGNGSGNRGLTLLRDSSSTDDGDYGVLAVFCSVTSSAVVAQRVTVTNADRNGKTVDGAAVGIKRGGGGVAKMGDVTFTGLSITDTTGRIQRYFTVEDFSNVGVDDLFVGAFAHVSGAPAGPLGMLNGRGVDSVNLGHPPLAPASGATIGSFAAAPTSIAAGGSATLSWTTSGATSVAIDHGVGTVAASGSVVVAPTSTTTYALTATGGGATATAAATVTVVAVTPAPSIGSFTANPATIAPGGSATLAWTTANASSVSIDGIGPVAASGSLAVAPGATTTYTLSAGGGGQTVTAATTVTVTSAHGGPIVSGHRYEVVAKHSGKALDVQGGPGATQDGALVQQWTYGGGANQRWRVDANADGSYTLTAQHSGKVLDAAGWATTAGSPVIQWTGLNGANQHWRIVDQGGGWCTVTNVNSGLVLDVRGGTAAVQDGAPVEQWNDEHADNERWMFVDLDGAIASGQWYEVVSLRSGKVLDVAGISTAPGAAVHQWSDWGGPNQAWRIDAVGDGSYELISRNSGDALDVAGASLADGGDLIQWPLHGGANQRWRFDDAGGGTWRITNVNSGKVLDVDIGADGRAGYQDGARIQQWSWLNGDNQRWTLVPVAPAALGMRAIDAADGAIAAR